MRSSGTGNAVSADLPPYGTSISAYIRGGCAPRGLGRRLLAPYCSTTCINLKKLSEQSFGCIYLKVVDVHIEPATPAIADGRDELVVSFTQDARLRIDEALAVRILFTALGGKQGDDLITWRLVSYFVRGSRPS